MSEYVFVVMRFRTALSGRSGGATGIIISVSGVAPVKVDDVVFGGIGVVLASDVKVSED